MTDYHQNADQREREQVLRNDKRVASTFLDHTHNNDEGGRFAKPQNVIGSEPTAQYPMAAPNWSVDPTGVEPPLNIDVNAVEPCGEKFEIEASCGDAAPPHPDRAIPLDASAVEPASSLGDVTTTEISSGDIAQSQLVASPTPTKPRRR
jgi:hypothetical protein